MKRITAIARGEVQRVGYRDEVERIARRLKLTGYVENLKPYDVKVVAEGEEEKLREFIELIKIKRFPIFVESIEVEWSDATGEFSYFEIKRGEWQEELFERLDTAGRLLYRSVELSEKSVKLGEETLKAMREESEKTRQTIKEESEKTREEIRMLRQDLREYIEVSLKEIHSKISKIEKALKKAGIM